MRRLTGLLAALALLLGASAVAAYADDAPGASPTPPSKPGDPFNGATLPPGDVFLVTPSDGTSTLPDPADPDAVQSQIDADTSGAPDPSSTGGPTTGSTADPDGDGTPGTSDGATSGDTGEETAATEDADEDSSGPAWWVYLVGVAALGALGGAAWRVTRSRRSR